jgi:hypothetical protein
VKIDPSLPGNSVSEGGRLKPRLPAIESETDSFQVLDSTGLNQHLVETDEVRSDKVARARELIAARDYPSAEAMGGVAALLAKELRKQPEPS